MIVAPNGSGLGELGFSLKPPKWLRNAVKSVTSGAKVAVNVPTPAGPVNVADPSSAKAVADAIRNAQVTVTTGKPVADSPGGGVREYVENRIPGGWITIAGGVLGGLLLLNLMRGARR